MWLDQLMPSFSDELEKLAVSTIISPFRKSRIGRPPIRVHTLLNNENMRDRGDEPAMDREKPQPSAEIEYEGGSGIDEGRT